LPVGGGGAGFVRSFPLGELAPVIVRSSAVGEDSPTASAAGQYLSLPGVVDPAGLVDALTRCQQAYDTTHAQAYRARTQPETGGMALLVQQQIAAVVVGVLFTRSPLDAQDIVIETARADTAGVVSGQVTPEQLFVKRTGGRQGQCLVPDTVVTELVALALKVEAIFKDVPQDIEWCWDGARLWLLQSRPITTLTPLWTRTIAAEVLPGLIRPLTWSINQPMTCGVWGEVFGLVLGETGLDFKATATLHRGRAYFNATLLGEIFTQMGLPEQGLEFLVRGKSFTRPPLGQVLKNIPGLWRLIQRERGLAQSFPQADFQRVLSQLQAESPGQLNDADLWARVGRVRAALTEATLYSILVPLGLAVRQAIFKVPEGWLDYRMSPEVQAVARLKALAEPLRGQVAGTLDWSALAQSPLQAVCAEVDRVVADYGYLSEASTDIAAVTWREAPATVHHLFLALLQVNPPAQPKSAPTGLWAQWKTRIVQQRLDLKGQTSALYSQLIAQLRWTFLEVAARLVARGVLVQTADIFYLTESEVHQAWNGELGSAQDLLPARQAELAAQQGITPPLVVYGTCYPDLETEPLAQTGQIFKGIPASKGRVEGVIQVVASVTTPPAAGTILVVPYTDAAWASVLVQAGGLIAEVGGQLSHGAIIAREYGIPAVMNIEGAMVRFRSGQRVRLDGAKGTVEILE